MYRKQVLLEKLKEAAASVLPISLIVLAICFVLVPVDTGLMLSFVLATAMLILGMGLFTLGAEMSMSKIGNYMGSKLTKSRKLPLILTVSFALGVAITVAPVVTPPESNAMERKFLSVNAASANTIA